MIQQTVLFTGHVQGVGFRFTTQRIASGFVVTGYVRNLEDGRVELVAEGERPEIEALLTELRNEMAGHIRDESTDTRPATGAFRNFSIRY